MSSEPETAYVSFRNFTQRKHTGDETGVGKPGREGGRGGLFWILQLRNIYCKKYVYSGSFLFER